MKRPRIRSFAIIDANASPAEAEEAAAMFRNIPSRGTRRKRMPKRRYKFGIRSYGTGWDAAHGEATSPTGSHPGSAAARGYGAPTSGSQQGGYTSGNPGSVLTGSKINEKTGQVKAGYTTVQTPAQKAAAAKAAQKKAADLAAKKAAQQAGTLIGRRSGRAPFVSRGTPAPAPKQGYHSGTGGYYNPENPGFSATIGTRTMYR